METSDIITYLVIATGIMAMVTVGYSINDIYQHEEDYGLGSVVTTTAEYEYLTNDSFGGVVVRGETRDDPALTVLSVDGEERRIATAFLVPV